MCVCVCLSGEERPSAGTTVTTLEAVTVVNAVGAGTSNKTIRNIGMCIIIHVHVHAICTRRSVMPAVIVSHFVATKFLCQLPGGCGW